MQLRSLTGLRDRSYEGAAALYEKTKPFRDGRGEGAHCLSPHSKDYLMLRRVPNKEGDAYAFRYHNTDVVLWRSRDTVDVHAWGSLSTNTFFNAYCPRGLRADFANDDGYFIHAAAKDGARVYSVKTCSTWLLVDGYWLPDHADIDKIAFIDRDDARNRIALKSTRFYEFGRWLDAVFAITNRPPMSSRDHRSIGEHQIANMIDEADETVRDLALLSLLADPNKWDDLRLTSIYRDYRAPYCVTSRKHKIMEALREEVLREAKLPPTHEVSYLSPGQHVAQRALRNKYSWV